MKPILIDALHINTGGALMILNHLVNKLVSREIDFVILKDNRCPKLDSEEKIHKLISLSSDNRTRNNFYKNHQKDFHSILCLGNIPPGMKMPSPVYTYIHNVSILEIPSTYPFQWKIKNILKRYYIKYLAKYTDKWIVQTSHTASLVKKHLPCKGKDIHIFPFYHVNDRMNKTDRNRRTDYTFIGEHTNAKGHEYLLEAWIKLSKTGFDKTLHLTVGSPTFKPEVDKAIKCGAKIVNHGHISFDEVVEVYNMSKAIIYPSLNESFGLGIVEAVESGCDVIGADLPYLHSICSPSLVFKPASADSIVEAVLKYETKENIRKTVLSAKDMADDLINFLISN